MMILRSSQRYPTPGSPRRIAPGVLRQCDARVGRRRRSLPPRRNDFCNNRRGSHVDAAEQRDLDVALQRLFVNESQGWTVGLNGTIVATRDGGATWPPRTSGTTSQLQGVWFVSETTGWVAASDGTILGTRDGGTTWAAQNSGNSNGLQGLYFVNPTTGWAVGAGRTILRTTTGGADGM